MRGLDKLHPEMRAKAERLQELCRENGLPLLITETWRAKEEQDALYAKGRTAPGKVVTNCAYPYSAHCWGVAFDFCRNVKGKEYETADGFFQKVGALGKGIGLFWGGDFKSFKDMPHFEHPGYVVNNSVKTLVEKWGTPEAFRKSWTSEAPAASVPQHVPAPTAEAEEEDSKWHQPDALKKLPPPNQTLVAIADDPWEWAARSGLVHGINRADFITAEVLINLLYKYNAAT